MPRRLARPSEFSVPEVRALFSSADVLDLPRLVRHFRDDDRAGVKESVARARGRLRAERAETRRVERLHDFETDLREQGYTVIAGVDEVGRGALAGPVTAAAVILAEETRIAGLDDSKRLVPERRAEIARSVRAEAVCISVAHVSHEEIDAVGIAQAVRRAMRLALDGLEVVPDHVVVDGLPVGVAEHESAVVSGDSIVACIAAASVVAKVSRDALMVRYENDFPGYGFSLNKGYGTTEHVRAITEIGLSPIHRRSFAPCGGTIPLFLDEG